MEVANCKFIGNVAESPGESTQVGSTLRILEVNIFWMNLQSQYDLEKQKDNLGNKLSVIPPLKVTAGLLALPSFIAGEVARVVASLSFIPPEIAPASSYSPRSVFRDTHYANPM